MTHSLPHRTRQVKLPLRLTRRKDLESALADGFDTQPHTHTHTLTHTHTYTHTRSWQVKQQLGPTRPEDLESALAEDFEFVAPIVGPLTKSAIIDATTGESLPFDHHSVIYEHNSLQL